MTWNIKREFIKNIGNNLGKHLLEKRLKENLTRKELAKIININEATIKNVENNKVKDYFRYYVKITNFLGYCLYEKLPKKDNEKIIFYRKKYGLSQKELARILKIDPSTLASYEQGNRKDIKSQFLKIKSKLSFF